MNGRERLLRTLRHQPTDRVPVAPFTYYNSIYEMFDYKPSIKNYFDPPDFDPIQKFVEFCDFYGFDVLHVLGSVWDLWVGNSLFDQSIVKSHENWEVTLDDQYKEDDELLRTVTIRTPQGNLRMVESHNRTSKYLVVSAAQEHLIKDRRDFEIFRRYAPAAEIMDCSLIRGKNRYR